MSAPSEIDADPAGSAQSNGVTTAAAADTGVLSQLPRTRPQRSSPRRDAARRAAKSAPRVKPAEKSAGKPAAKAAKATTQPAPARRAKAPAKAKRAAAATGVRATTPSHATPKRIRVAAEPAATPVPRQGFESESDRARGPVRPPGGAELLTSAVEIVGELTKAGFSTGERLVRDVFSLLPRG